MHRGPKAPHSRPTRRASTSTSPPQTDVTDATVEARPQTNTPPVTLPFLDGSVTSSSSVGPGLTDLLFSAIGWEPSAVETGYASATVPAVATTETMLSPPRVPGDTTQVESTSMLGRITQIQQRWRDLSQTLTLRYPSPGTSGHEIASRGMDLFFEYLYPLTPLVHKASLHRALLLLEGNSAAFSEPETGWPPANNLDPSLGPSIMSIPSPPAPSIPSLQPEEAFTLVTAVCAQAAFMLPAAVYPEGSSVGDLFLEASRNCLNSYLETDLEAPNANSIIIRYFHSNCLHGTGRPKYSWHIFGEATRLIQAMGLHDASLLAGLSPLEAEMRRRAFWIVYMGDKSAAILNGRPMTIHRFSFDSNITLPYPTNLEDDLVGGADSQKATGKSCIVGFNANLELWQVASHLLLEIRVQKDKEAKQPPTTSLADQRRYFHSLYVSFITELDRLPSFLQPWHPTPPDGDSFMSQTVNLFVSFYCLRVVILQTLQQLACFQDSPDIESVDLRTTEIVRDMLRLLHDAPFWALQVNGEPLVEKVRLLGGSLLAIIHRHEESNEASSPLAARARADFSVLFNILSRLDSRASDALKTRLPAVV
ncbi:hypothetical protein SEUCBS140593_005876 [Sporothrix eucalyptigena]|uniref:Xylanolytic transcriptional activator regulatory domain-containing protein n=1 Tax=Sporothrix eucalyptigena TaxID=1812306 RepID=A0ABP0C052_9PEZI